MSNASSPVAENKDWYKGGYETPVDAKRTGGSQVFRFYVKIGDPPTAITFLDSAPHNNVVKIDGADVRVGSPFITHEHNWLENGQWGNYATCLKSATNSICPHCDRSEKSYPSQTAFYTIIDHRKTVSKKGVTFENEQRLFAVKTSSATYALLRDFRDELNRDLAKATENMKKAEAGKDPKEINRCAVFLDDATSNLERYNLSGLRGARFLVSRTAEKTPAVGDRYKFDGWTKLDDKVYEGKDTQPLNYLLLLKPDSIEAATKRLGNAQAAVESQARESERPAY